MRMLGVGRAKLVNRVIFWTGSMNTHFDVAIVGAGPAGLFTAYELALLSPNLSIAIIDIGKKSIKRKCPLVNSKICPTCDLCDIVHGVGGAGMYSDGKLSAFPAGSGLASTLGRTEYAQGLSDYVYGIFEKKFIGQAPKITKASTSGSRELNETLDSAGLSLKTYDVMHVGSEGIQEFCAELEQHLAQRGVTFLYKHQVKEVHQVDGYFEIEGTVGEMQFLYDAQSVVMATGKASGRFLRNLLDQLNVAYSFNQIEMGVRVEARADALTCFTSSHLDAKIKLRSDSEEVRSFCMCTGGYLAKCFYDSYLPDNKICTISGYSLRDRKSENSNFGILVRKAFKEHEDPINAQLPFIEKINDLPGFTAVQRLEDFFASRATTMDQLLANSVKSTLDESAPVNLKEFLPDYVVRGIEHFIRKLGKVSPHLAHRDTLLHAPVWELCWDRVSTTSNLETSVEGFYVIGDALGVARGIIQGGMTGVVVARTIVSKRACQGRSQNNIQIQETEGSLSNSMVSCL
ncbi:MAG: hypothetical protein H6619_00460 [Deltaproteobacteria bacterium]|nr:hypothetical protein [Deltaproteobacteria bacterium]